MKKKKSTLLSGVVLLLMFAMAPVANAGTHPETYPTDGSGSKSKVIACTPQGYCPIPN